MKCSETPDQNRCQTAAGHVPSVAIALALLCCLVLASVRASAQETIRFDRLTIDEGLPQNTVRSITQDREGFMWFATQNGLARYDGYEFTVYRHDPSDPASISSSQINALFVDDEGELWVGTEGSVLERFDRARQTFVHFPLFPPGAKPLNNGISVIAADAGKPKALIVVSNSALYRFDVASGLFAPAAPDTKVPGTFDDVRIPFVKAFIRRDRRTVLDMPPLPDASLISVVEEAAGTSAWIGTFNQGLVRLERSERDGPPYSVTHYVHDPEDPSSISDNIIMSLFTDRTGVLWVGTFTGGLSIYRGQRAKFTPYLSNPESPHDFRDTYVRALHVGRANTIWIGGTSTGLWKYERGSRTYENFLVDERTTHPMRNSIRSLAEDPSGTIWVGAEMGLFVYSPRQNRLVRASTLFPDQHRILDEACWPIFADSSSLWIGKMTTMYQYDLATGSMRERHSSKIPGHSSVYCIEDDRRGSLWLGHYLHGLSKIEKSTGKVLHHFMNDARDTSSLGTDRVLSVLVDSKDRVWVGTEEGGLNLLNADLTFTRYTVRNGLPSNVIFGILEDGKNNLWISTSDGLSRFTPTTGQFKNFGPADGLMSKEFNGHSAVKNEKGEMFFGGVNGFVSFHPDSIRGDPNPPHVVLTGFTKFNTPVQLPLPLSETPSIELEYEENVFSFEFAALHYTDPLRNQLAYRMVGFDRDWVYCGSRRSATYTNLNPGTYQFRVKGSNCDGVWNESGVSIDVIVHPPYWGTWWFLAMSGTVIFLSIVFTVRAISTRKLRRELERIGRQRELERERLRISRDMHDDLGSRLTEMSLVSQLAKQTARQPEALDGHLDNLSVAADEIITSFDEIVWAVNPENDSLSNLADYLQQHAVEFIRRAGVKARFDIPVDVPAVQLSAEVRHNAFMVVKEALNNVVKYAAASEVRISLVYEPGAFTIVIDDDGSGFRAAEASPYGNGLKNMRRRIEELRGRFELRTAPGQGTTVTFTIPLHR